MASHAFCPSCGYPNDPQRGACAMCYAMLHQASGGASCPSCGAANPKTGNFCQSCQTALTGGVRPVPLADVSHLVGAAVPAGAAGAVAHDAGYAGHEDYVDDLHLPGADEHDDFAMAPPAPPAASAAPPPPPAPHLDDDFAAPPPPPGAVELDFDEAAAPPPPPPGAAPAGQAPAKQEDDLADWSLDYDDA